MSATMTAASHAANPLIAGARVAGTEVYNTAGEHLGSIYDVMLDKATGKVAYAIMSFGGFLGLGEKYHPIPWSMLDYDVEKGGYVVPLTREKLEAAPMYGADGEPDWHDKEYGKRVQRYLRHVENLLWPDLIIIGGGVSKESGKLFPFVSLRTDYVAAELLNSAGIVGAAVVAEEHEA